MITQNVHAYLLQLQDDICSKLELLDTKAKFIEDCWQRPEGGGGKSRILANGAIFERAGVNFSCVEGENLPQAATIRRPELAGRKFTALGVSVVIHPENPYIPTTHANVRFILAYTANEPAIWWFGGGFDLTPYYGFKEDCYDWHNVARKACAPFGEDLYQRFKTWADNYFYLPHRQEPRGIGGLFFDDYNEGGFDASFGFMQSIGNSFMLAYAPIVQRRKSISFGKQEREFQKYRRGRYVEFNLLYDRGTLFGLQSNGRTESILMSLPPEVRWDYNWQPAKNSAEEKLYTEFLPPRDWLAVR